MLSFHSIVYKVLLVPHVKTSNKTQTQLCYSLCVLRNFDCNVLCEWTKVSYRRVFVVTTLHNLCKPPPHTHTGTPSHLETAQHSHSLICWPLSSNGANGLQALPSTLRSANRWWKPRNLPHLTNVLSSEPFLKYHYFHYSNSTQTPKLFYNLSTANLLKILKRDFIFLRSHKVFEACFHCTGAIPSISSHKLELFFCVIIVCIIP